VSANIGFIRFVCALPAASLNAPVGPTLFRTYKVAKNNTYNCKIWEAARATSAAPTFFKAMDIGPEGLKTAYVDPGLGYNNPMDQLLQEAELVFGANASYACILSIGTGVRPITDIESKRLKRWLPKRAIEALKSIATNTEVTAERMKRQFGDRFGVVYHRLNVSQGLEK
jgi:predicted acylesterase/phospholipase RssA